METSKNYNIYLIGMPASGKSTLGKILSKRLNRKFLDLDELIVKQENKTIPEIFEADGENRFREIEKEMLHSVTGSKLIIATGGGAPCFFNNLEHINNNGISVWINVTPDILANRVLKKAGSRPLLKNYEDGGLEGELKQKFERRKRYYQQANIIFDPTIHKISDLISQIESMEKAS